MVRSHHGAALVDSGDGHGLVALEEHLDRSETAGEVDLLGGAQVLSREDAHCVLVERPLDRTPVVVRKVGQPHVLDDSSERCAERGDPHWGSMSPMSENLK